MKQILKYSSVSLALAALLVGPVLAVDIILPTPPPTGTGQALTGSGIVGIITTIVNYGITIATVIAIAMFIYGGVRYAMGDASATKILRQAAIGLLAILGVGLLINTIAKLVQNGLNVG